MNASKTQNILKDLKTKINNVETNTSNINEINTKLVDIGITLSKNENIKIFSAYLTDGTNEYLANADYTSNPINFTWTNTFDKPVYITRYDFCYPETTAPSSDGMFHSTKFTTKIGAMNDDGNDYENNYITIKQNLEWPQTNGIKRTFFSNTSWTWICRFNEISAPVCIGISKKFGHYINGDFQLGSNYDDAPTGIINGYYYDN